MAGHDPNLLSVRDLSLGFAAGGSVLTAVNAISFDVAAGETLALLGESGCGKSATALGLMRLLPSAGRVLGGQVGFAGRELLALSEQDMRGIRGRGMAMIFQEPATSLNPVLAVSRQIGEVLGQHGGITGSAARDRAEALLASVGIADPARRLDEYPFQLSGGMKQRVMIAMALAGEPQLLVADEPTTALDVTIQAQILDLMLKLQAERAMGMLLITHDLGVVAKMAHRVAVMYAGEIVEEAPREAFFGTPRHPYTQALFAALPDMTARGRALQTIPGQVPPLSGMPAGCRFAARCPQAWARCTAEVPQWSEPAPGHRVRCHLVAEGRSVAQVAVSAPVSDSTAGAAPPSLEVRELRVHFPIRRGVLQRVVGHVRAVDGVSLALRPGRTLALVGESGCGKTTVGKSLLQLVRPSGGQVLLDGRDIAGLGTSAMRPLRRKLQMVFQDPFASLDPRMRVGDILSEGMQALGVGSGGDMVSAVAAMLEQVGLDAGAAARYPHEFSGGQRQRIAIARALAVQPEVLICDEPTSALDVSVQAQILNLLAELQSRLGLAYLFITHNFGVVEYIADEIAVMYLGRIVEHGSAAEVLDDPRHPYTRALLSAVPSPRPARDGVQQVIRLPGETPSPANPPAGCHFHPRCTQATAACRSSYPAPTQLSASRIVRCHLAQ